MVKVKKKWYAIKMIDGQEMNLIVETWEECSQLVLHHTAVYKSFLKKEDANTYLLMPEKEAKAIKEKTNYCQATKKTEKVKYKNYSIKIPIDLADKFDQKLGIMIKTPSQIMEDYIREWVE